MLVDHFAAYLVTSAFEQNRSFALRPREWSTRFATACDAQRFQCCFASVERLGGVDVGGEEFFAGLDVTDRVNCEFVESCVVFGENVWGAGMVDARGEWEDGVACLFGAEEYRVRFPSCGWNV